MNEPNHLTTYNLCGLPVTLSTVATMLQILAEYGVVKVINPGTMDLFALGLDLGQQMTLKK
jgi:hypothetical protein